MNKHKLLILGSSLMLLITSCRKNDVQHENNMTSNPAAVVAPTTESVSKTSEWKTISNWASSKQEKFTTYTSKVEDANITSAVTAGGMVLAFAKNGNSIQALPFQEKGTNDAYWYYQVSNGAVTLSVDAYTGTPSVNAAGFRYIVLSPEQLKDLAANGHSKTELMQLSYENLVAVLNK
jgi:hypothetical protein